MDILDTNVYDVKDYDEFKEEMDEFNKKILDTWKMFMVIDLLDKMEEQEDFDLDNFFVLHEPRNFSFRIEEDCIVIDFNEEEDINE